jgi:phospholipid transport system transporter-binding protein
MKLPEIATLEQAPGLLGQVDAALAAAGGAPVVIDASALRDFDTSAVALLLEARRRGKRANVEVRIDGVPPKLVELARLYGVDELLSLPPA